MIGSRYTFYVPVTKIEEYDVYMLPSQRAQHMKTLGPARTIKTKESIQQKGRTRALKPKSHIHQMLNDVNLTILCADDNYFNIEILRLTFGKLDLQDYCSYVSDGQEVVEWCKKNFEKAKEAQENQILFLLSDLEMPYKNGLQACKEVRKLYADQEDNGDDFVLHMPTFALSSCSFMVGAKQNPMDQDIDYMICKPPDEQEILKIVQVTIRRGLAFYGK